MNKTSNIAIGISCLLSFSSQFETAFANQYSSRPQDLSKKELIEILSGYSLLENDTPIEVDSLIKEFKVNSLRAKNKYNSKPVFIKVKVYSLDKNLQGNNTILFHDSSKTNSHELVSCLNVTNRTATQISKGEIYSIYGTVNKPDYGISMNWCYFPAISKMTPSQHVDLLLNSN